MFKTSLSVTEVWTNVAFSCRKKNKGKNEVKGRVRHTLIVGLLMLKIGQGHATSLLQLV